MPSTLPDALGSPCPEPLPLPLPEGWPVGLALRLEGVRVVRGPKEILRGIDLEFLPDRRAIVIGPSGAGKSTLLRLLNRLEDPISGRLLLGELPLRSLPVRTLRRAIAVVPQDPRPLPGTLRDNLRYPSEIACTPTPDDDVLGASMAEFGLSPDWLDRDAAGLSGGERRRLAMIVALQTGPEILAIDEPTAALDPASSRRLVEALDRRSQSDGLRTIIVTHDRSLAPALGDEAIVIDGGRVVDRGPTVEVLRRNDDAAWGEGADGALAEHDR